MGVLDDLMRVFGGTMGEMPQAAPQVPDALSQLRDSVGGYGANSMRGFQTMREQLPQAASDVGTGLAGLAERLRLVATGRPVDEATVPVAQAIAPAAGLMEFGSGGLLNPLSAGLRGAGSALRSAGHAFADDTGAITIRGPKRPRPGIGHNQPPPEYQFPQYAEAYPEVGPGIPSIDKNTKKPFMAKGWTPEMRAFEKERNRIIKDMRENGYEPYYDPAQRYHVDPAHYPPNADTTAIVPAKQETIDRHMAKIGSEPSRERLRAAYQRGSEMPNTSDWYAMGQLEADYIKDFGPVAGRRAFQDRFATSMAATTGGANPEANFLMSAYGNYLRAKGLPYPEAAYQMPYPIGGRYASGNMAMHQKLFDQGGWPALGAGNPKRHNFAQDFTGNRNAMTMDEQMVSGMTPGVSVPPQGTYGLYERVAAEEAAKVGEAGVLPQNYQDVAWAGFKNLKDKKYTSGEPMIQTVNESIERTHRLTGMPRDEVARRMRLGDIPMYGLLGTVGLGVGALDDQ